MVNTLRGTVLVAEDDADYRGIMVRALERAGHRVIQATNGTQALKLLERETVDAIVTDLLMPQADGLTVLRSAFALSPPVPTLVVTGYATVETAVEAMHLGAIDYIVKPVDSKDLQVCVHQALERRKMLAGSQGFNTDFGDLIGTAPPMQALYDQIRRVAPFKSTVLIEGESGTGKELVTRAIHALSPYNNGPLVAVNCSALPKDLVESQLFGHEKGAFYRGPIRAQRLL